MNKCDIKVGDIVHTKVGTGEVIAISKTGNTLMVKTFDNREIPVRLEYIIDVFDNYKQ